MPKSQSLLAKHQPFEGRKPLQITKRQSPCWFAGSRLAEAGGKRALLRPGRSTRRHRGFEERKPLQINKIAISRPPPEQGARPTSDQDQLLPGTPQYHTCRGDLDRLLDWSTFEHFAGPGSRYAYSSNVSGKLSSQVHRSPLTDARRCASLYVCALQLLICAARLVLASLGKTGAQPRSRDIEVSITGSVVTFSATGIGGVSVMVFGTEAGRFSSLGFCSFRWMPFDFF